jgi:nucleotide-binding universal stress UspA family protein
VEFAKVKEVDAVVVGSRGLGSIKRSLMSLVGLGSVSDYCIHQLHVPVLVVRGDGAGTAAAPAEVGGV